MYDTPPKNSFRLIGANCGQNESCEFTVWAPHAREVILEILQPAPRRLAMQQDAHGCWRAAADNVRAGTRYWYDLGKSRKLPDPASFYQPQGVHGPSEVVDHREFVWEDADWKGIPLTEMIIYELHVGTFTAAGTFDAIIPRLSFFSEMGINAVELMPVSQFPGMRNWGYDGVYPFAVQDSYGGPQGLKRLVNACHKNGLALILDVVYNHLGPEGNYLGEFGPYFTDKYRTPWGRAVNFDGPHSDGVRDYFIGNALYWFQQYHCDALRLDAIHGIFDLSAKHILEELSEAVENFRTACGHTCYLIAESDLNNPRVISDKEMGGYGIDAQWCDDFHHALHTLLTGEQEGYYADFGSVNHLKSAFIEGYVYTGQYSPFRRKRHGAPLRRNSPGQFIVYSQNHDQVGNRTMGERLSALVGFEGLKLAAGTVFISPYIPLLFMGEEYGEEAPFFYFIDHSDPDLIRAVREGRRKEFRAFVKHREPPDPQSRETFRASTLKWENRTSGRHGVLLNFYQRLIVIKKNLPVLRDINQWSETIAADEKRKVMLIERGYNGCRICGILNFSAESQSPRIDISQGKWNKLLDSADKLWEGPGSLLPDVLATGSSYSVSPLSFALYQKE